MAFLKRIAGTIAHIWRPLTRRQQRGLKVSDDDQRKTVPDVGNAPDSSGKRKRESDPSASSYKRQKLSSSSSSHPWIDSNGQVEREVTENDFEQLNAESDRLSQTSSGIDDDVEQDALMADELSEESSTHQMIDGSSSADDRGSDATSMQHGLNEASFVSDLGFESDMDADEDDARSVRIDSTSTGTPDVRPRHRQVPAIAPDGNTSGFTADRLRAAGWDDSHVRLMSHVAERGRERVFPTSWRQGMPFIPDGLFSNRNYPLLRPHKFREGAGEIMFDHLLKMGGAMRGVLHKREGRTPQQIAERYLKRYMKWIVLDSGLHGKRALPIIKLIVAPRHMDNKAIVAKATEAIHNLADRYKQAFRARQSTEVSFSTLRKTPGSPIFHELPTLYALVASDAIVALAGVQPDDPTRRLISVAFFDYSTPDLDFWSSLALVQIFAHGRDMQIAIAEETGLGCKLPTDVAEHDPDV